LKKGMRKGPPLKSREALDDVREKPRKLRIGVLGHRLERMREKTKTRGERREKYKRSSSLADVRLLKRLNNQDDQERRELQRGTNSLPVVTKSLKSIVVN